MGCPGRAALLLLALLPAAACGKSSNLPHKVVGETCEDHRECQSRCCVTNSQRPQKFCTPQTIFLKCLSWRKPRGFSCRRHSECKSSCCVRTGPQNHSFCVPRAIFLQCVPWRKPHGALCTGHGQCLSHCCLPLSEVSPARCLPRTGVLVLCLPL